MLQNRPKWKPLGCNAIKSNERLKSGVLSINHYYISYECVSVWKSLIYFLFDRINLAHFLSNQKEYRMNPSAVAKTQSLFVWVTYVRVFSFSILNERFHRRNKIFAVFHFECEYKNKNHKHTHTKANKQDMRGIIQRKQQ